MNYKKIYESIIDRAKNRKLNSYKEKHHIIPKCIGGNDDETNLVELTAKEHFICHLLLCEIYPNENKIKFAAWMMCSMITMTQTRAYIVSSKEYEYYKNLCANTRKGKSHTEETKRKIREKRALQVMVSKGPRSEETKRKISERNIGKTMSYESRRKISVANRGKIRSDATREKLRSINTGKKLSEIHKDKISNSLFGRVHSEETRKKIRESNIGKNLGKYPSEETRAKLSKAATGRKHTEESKEKMRIKSIGNRSRTGMPHRAETKEKIRNAHRGIKKNPESVYKNFLAQKKKPIEQYDVDGNFLQEYVGIRSASRITGIKRQSLVSALNGKSKTSGGFIWKYKITLESESQNG